MVRGQLLIARCVTDIGHGSIYGNWQARIVGHVKDLRISYGPPRCPKDRFADEKTAQRIGLLTVFFNPQTLSVSVRSRSG